MTRFGPALLLLFLAACGSSPPTHFFSLDPVPGTRIGGMASGPPVVLDQVSLPPVLDRDELVRLAPDGRVQVSSQSRWAAPLDRLCLYTLGQDLADRLPPGAIAAPGLPRPSPRRDLAIAVESFAPTAQGDIVLKAEWTVSAGLPLRVVLRQSASATIPAGPDSQAAAMSLALGRLADQIAASLEP